MFSVDYLRSFKIAEYAIFDIVISFVGVYILAPLLSRLFLKINLNVPRISWLFFTLPLSIIVHFLVNNITPMTRNFIDIHGNYGLKIIILILIILGIQNIKRLN